MNPNENKDKIKTKSKKQNEMKVLYFRILQKFNETFHFILAILMAGMVM